MKIELKEGRHYDVDRTAGVIKFRVATPMRAKVRFDFDRLGKVEATMETTFFRGLWFSITSSLTRAR